MPENHLHEPGVANDYTDLEADVTAGDKARAVSGRTKCSVTVFTNDGKFVEPSDAELREKIPSLQA